MHRYRVSIVVQVEVEDMNEDCAMRAALARGEELKKTGYVSAVLHAVKISHG